MGASVGVFFAVQNPGVVKKLVICDTIRCAPVVSGAEDAFEPRVELAQTKEDAIATLTEQTLGRWFSEPWRSSHPEETERMRRLLNTTRREGFIACCHALRDRSYDLSPLLGKIGSSVDEAMLVVGEIDANLPEAMAQMRLEVQTGFGTRSVVQWAVIKGSGHLPMIDNPEQYNAEVLRFLKS